MKKIFTIFIMLVLVSSFVLAAENQEKDIEQNQAQIRVQTQEQNSEGEKQISEAPNKNVITAKQEAKEKIQELREQTFTEIKELKIKNAAELKEAIKEKREILKEAMKEEKEKIRETKEKQNEVRLAVQTLLASENLTGGVGKQVSAIARDFDNSAKETESSEEKIMNRGRFMKALFGGDRKDAELIRTKLQTREEKIQQLEELVNACDCTDDVKVLLQEQIQVMKQEQERLKTLADNEGSSTGLLGWMFK